jgi:hypothetical protein
MKLFLVLAAIALVHAGCTVGPMKCFDDHNRILSQINVNYDEGNSNEWCAQLCFNHNTTLAGVEDGIECRCGNAISPGDWERPMGECNMTCPSGPANETCGAGWRIQIFTFTVRPKTADVFGHLCET